MFRGSKKRWFRALTLVLAAVLIVGGVVSGTVAWLIAETEPVVNTFSYGDIDLKLDETKTDKDGNPIDENGNPIVDQDGDGFPENTPTKTTEGNEYAMIPGEEYLKDPTVTVLAGNEACWLFVKLDEIDGSITNADGSVTSTGAFGDYLTYTIGSGWTQLYEDGFFNQDEHKVEGVYYRFVGEDTDNVEVAYPVLMDNKICVKGEVTKEMLNALDNNGQEDKTKVTYPRLSITAYAVQYRGFEAEVSEGAGSATDEQVNTAVLKAWNAVEAQNATTNP